MRRQQSPRSGHPRTSPRQLPALALALLALLGLLGPAPEALAQAQSGNVYLVVTGTDGEALPGVAVTLSGIGAPEVRFTDAQGEVRFLGLDPGRYALEARLEGFAVVEVPEVLVSVGKNTSLEATLASAITDSTEVVSSARPLIDQRQTSTGTNISQVELETVPTARDPWALLSQAPGVSTDRINVGGNESGQQSNYLGTGAMSSENAVAVDGVVVTDMASVSSPTYFDFGAFEEVEIRTGGSDVTAATSGVTLNMVTRRGSNGWRGSGRGLVTDSSWQSSPDVDPGDLGRNSVGGETRVQEGFIPNQVESVEEIGLEAGGDILRDRLWVWGAFSESDIATIAGGGDLDETTLENQNVKVNAEVTTTTSGVLQYSNGDKIKSGRGAGPTRATETLWNQDGPTRTYKGEVTQIFGSSLYLTGLYSFVDGGFLLDPRGGLDADVVQGTDGVFRGSFTRDDNDRDVNQYRADGSAFFELGERSHELRFGASYRQADVDRTFQIPRNRISYACEVFGCSSAAPGDREGVVFYRDLVTSSSADYTAAWLQDVFVLGDVTVSAGLRYDLQEGVNNPSGSAPVVVGGRELIPGLSFEGNDGGGFEWADLSPRLGVTWGVGDDGRTVLRASYARFAEQLTSGDITRVNPVGLAFSYGYFTDANGNTILDPAEVDSYNLLNFSGFDPANPNALASPNVTDPDLEASTTDEVILGLDHALGAHTAVGVTATWRNISDILETQRFVRGEDGVKRVVERGDFVRRTTSDGLEYFALRPGVRNAGGFLLTNGDRGQDYLGLTLSATRRLANRWSLRGYLNYADWTWDVPDSYFDHQDPTNVGGGVADGTIDGEQVAPQSTGSGNKGSVYYGATWTANLNGIYQVAPDRPWGFNVGANLTAREGYVNPIFRTVVGTDGIARPIQLTREVDDLRNDDVYVVDLRLEKELFWNDLGMTVSLDGFNLLNDSFVLQRQRDQGATEANFITETVSPRIFRVGLTLSYR